VFYLLTDLYYIISYNITCIIIQINPTATINADVGFETAPQRGTVRHVNLSDIKSGKVKIPNMKMPFDDEANEDKAKEDSINPSSSNNKGFKR